MAARRIMTKHSKAVADQEKKAKWGNRLGMTEQFQRIALQDATNDMERNPRFNPPVTDKLTKCDSVEVMDTSMECEKTRIIGKTETRKNTKPRDMFPPEYRRDIVEHMQTVESQLDFPADFLERGHLNPHMRGIVVDWIIQVAYHQELEEEALQTTISLMDRYISQNDVSCSVLQLVGITCLYLGAKYVDRFPPTAVDLCRLTDNTYSVADLYALEIDILKNLNFDLSVPVPHTFLDIFININTFTQEQYHFAQYVTNLSLTDHQIVHHVPSLVAASSLLVARLVFKEQDDVWPLWLASNTNYRLGDLFDCVIFMINRLATADHNTFPGSKRKFSSSKRMAISSRKLDSFDLANAVRSIFPPGNP